MVADTTAASCCRLKNPLGSFETFSSLWRIPRKINTTAQVVSKPWSSHATQSNPIIIETFLSHLTFCLILALNLTVQRMRLEKSLCSFFDLSDYSFRLFLRRLSFSAFNLALCNVFNCNRRSQKYIESKILTARRCIEFCISRTLVLLYIRGANSTQGLVLIRGPFIRGPALLLHEGAPFGVHPNCPPQGTTVSRVFSRSANSTGG